MKKETQNVQFFSSEKAVMQTVDVLKCCLLLRHETNTLIFYQLSFQSKRFRNNRNQDSSTAMHFQI